MPQTDWSTLASALVDELHLATPPLAITFSDAPPEGVARFDEPMPDALPDGRTGRVAAGCVFWIKAADRTFTTVAEDHGNCSVGSVTHGFKTLEDVAGNSDVAALLESGWVTMDVVPQIPVVHERPGAVTYGPLADTPVDPDVVFLRVNGRQLMVLSDAIPGSAHRGQAAVPHRGRGQGGGRARGERGVRVEPGAHRDAAGRDDVRAPGRSARRASSSRCSATRRPTAWSPSTQPTTPAASPDRDPRRALRRSPRHARLRATSWRLRSTGWRRTRGR